jgi:MoxR-like ATPase
VAVDDRAGGEGPAQPEPADDAAGRARGDLGGSAEPAPGGPADLAPLPLREVFVACEAVLERVQRAVVGKREALSMVLAGILAGGHVLLEDFPGLGKTLAARSFAQTLGLDFRRVQFTPDLLPADVTGSYLYDMRGSEFVFRPGPLFAGLLLADEINRTPPKTQAALLEAMQERQVTVEGRTFPLPRPFHVIATANPIEYEGTYPLPEAQLDRFLLRVSFAYPSRLHEIDVLRRRLDRHQEEITLDPVLNPGYLLRVQRAVEEVEVELSVTEYCVDLVGATRAHPQLLVGASPRGALALVLTARAHAVLQGRDFVTPEDVKAVAVYALAHRITLRPEMWMRRVVPADVVRAVLKEVPAPPTAGRPGSTRDRATGSTAGPRPSP